jgi:Flp pilus assembly protein CpaB
MLLAGALGVLLTLSVLRAADRSQPVFVAARELAPGTVLRDTDVRAVGLHADAAVIDTLFPASALDALRGRVVTATIGEGTLLTRAAVRDVGAAAARRVMSFALPRARAVDGRLEPGDRLDVLAVESDTGRAGYVLAGAEVVAVDEQDGGPLAGAGDDVTITIAVEPADAPPLVAALDTGTVTLVRATGAAPLGPVESFATGSG